MFDLSKNNYNVLLSPTLNIVKTIDDQTGSTFQQAWNMCNVTSFKNIFIVVTKYGCINALIGLNVISCMFVDEVRKSNRTNWKINSCISLQLKTNAIGRLWHRSHVETMEIDNKHEKITQNYSLRGIILLWCCQQSDFWSKLVARLLCYDNWHMCSHKLYLQAISISSRFVFDMGRTF